MAGIVKVRLTEYYPYKANMSAEQRLMEGGTNDRRGKKLYTLEDYIEGKAPYVSLACDYRGGPPGNVKEFRQYGFRVWIPWLTAHISSVMDTSNLSLISRFKLPLMIDFRLVDTGGHFFGEKKQVRVAGHEPIDVCRRDRPDRAHSFSGTLTELWLMGAKP